MTSTPGPVFVTLTQQGAALAGRLAQHLPGAQIHGLAGRVEGVDREFVALVEHLQGLYRDRHAIVGILSTGIMIRALAAVLSDKHQAPAVVCIAEDASAVVPLLGGHHGAHEIARMLGDALGVAPAFTTAGELRFGFALDDPPKGWRVGHGQAVKPVAAAILGGEPVALVNHLDPAIDVCWITGSGAPFTDAEAPLTLTLTERTPENPEICLSLHPATLALGVGCERGVEASEIDELVESALEQAGLAPGSIACVASIDVKEDEAAIRALAERLEVPLRLFSAERLEREAARLANPSDAVFDAVGTHGVAEAAALAAAGQAAELIVPKKKSARATCAVARARAILDADSVGRAVGSLAIVGLGPGSSAWRTPEATNVLANASDIVGYRLYIDLIGDLARAKTLHAYDLGQERERVSVALSLASEGKKVALISSGDAGIYAMASLVFELVDTQDRPEWQRLDIQVVPGISALQAAAARTGAPLGHDFCAISLSDLMTPWEVIEKRLRAAADGDFVVALYNPVSRRRTDQLNKARDILLQARPASTPVIIARNLGRQEESVDIIDLDGLRSDRVDMLSVVVIGASTTKITGGGDHRRWVYTPRGYDRTNGDK
jgi:cobalt-precorrin 5A hydrolase/precorrin-3B C17-methyltransferase